MKSLLGQVLDNYKYTDNVFGSGQEQVRDIQEMEIVCQSAGFNAGSFATIELLHDNRAQPIKLIFGRGLNVMVLNSNNGQVMETCSFDTRNFQYT
jgi:hypothetical protein